MAALFERVTHQHRAYSEQAKERERIPKFRGNQIRNSEKHPTDQFSRSSWAYHLRVPAPEFSTHS